MTNATLDSAGPGGTTMAQECLAVRVRLISRRLSRIYDAALRPLGITISQLNLLSVIDNMQPAPSGRVAALLSMEISTLSRNARIAQSEGWITIERAERGNGRVLNLTPAGRQKLLEALPPWQQAQAEARALLGPDGADTLWRLGNSVWDEQVGGQSRATS
jgi:DNA-binding MarR family transcriptional regulator